MNRESGVVLIRILNDRYIHWSNVYIKGWLTPTQEHTHQTDKHTGKLEYVRVGDWVQSPEQCVEDGDTGRDDDGQGLVNVQDHGQCGPWKCYHTVIRVPQFCACIICTMINSPVKRDWRSRLFLPIFTFFKWKAIYKDIEKCSNFNS